MSKRPKITDRSTSLAHAFVHAIIPREVDRAEQLRLYRQVGIDPDRCVYCGGAATDTDHFRGLVKGGRPSGHFHTLDNLVPCCGRCNQSKGGAEWRAWMLGKAKNSPKSRQVADLDARVARLEAFEALSTQPAHALGAFRDTVGSELWDDYWSRFEHMRQALVEAEQLAGRIRDQYQAATGAGDERRARSSRAAPPRDDRRRAPDPLDHPSGAKPSY